MTSLQNSANNDINVLLLGETGVGKSTFINAFVNYITYEKLDDALKEDLLSLIPTSFVVTDFETFEEQEVTIGQDSNESLKTGQSSTQNCRSYVFPFHENSILRIIDTPGIGNTRIDEDARNFQNIMVYLSNYHHLNGICWLLKPNESRLTVFFPFCIKKLLTHLHQSVINNIIFCFTNARSTFYSPGETASLLKKLLVELKQQTGIDIPFSKQNTFCFDNESFRFVATYKQGIHFDDIRKFDFEKSWDISVEQAAKLIERISQCEPYRFREKLSLNEARRLIYEITRPIAEIARNIQININVLKEKMAELNNTNCSIADLSKKLRIPTVDLECVVLPYPRTVCTAKSCTRHLMCNNQVKIDYNTHCHKHCYLQGAAQNVIDNSSLQQCEVMNRQGMCKYCGCSWNKHMHISYETEQVFKETVDRSVEAEIKTKEGAAAAIHRHKQILEQRINNFSQEQLTLTSMCSKFSKFLHENSITPYNNDLIKYVEHLVREEKEKRSVGTNNENIIDGLENMIDAYQQEINIYIQMLNSSEVRRLDATPQIGEIQQLIDRLYNLRYSGALLKKQIDIIRRGYHATANRYETVCASPTNKIFLSKLK